MYNFILLLLENIFEAVYFAIFMILGKNIKEKRFTFIGMMIFEYLILKYFIHYSVWFQIIYTFMSFIILKILYKEKSQITDIFLFMFASIFLIGFSFICDIPIILFKANYYLMLFLNRFLTIIIIFIFRKNIFNLYNKFYNSWNRKEKSKIKSLTLRNISIITFNLMLYILNIILIYMYFTK